MGAFFGVFTKLSHLGDPKVLLKSRVPTSCKTIDSTLLMVVSVMISLLLLTPLLYYTPNVVLATIIVGAVLGLKDYHATYFIWKLHKVDFLSCMGAFVGVIFILCKLDLSLQIQSSLSKYLLDLFL
ncbi:hypothetical protein SUGI_0097000 [Cryptomeria japonica]|nr:hypothetical protein SUGI_0097000 [Cryptomeria japonica]